MTISVCNLFFRAIISLVNVLVFAVFVAAQFFQDQDSKYFFKWMLGNRTSRYISDKYEVSNSLPWWIIYFWYGLHAWQGLWMSFSVAILFKRNFPNAIDGVFFFLYILSTGLDIAWVVFSSKEMIVPACVVIFLGVFLKIPALVLVYVKFEKSYDYVKHSLWDFWAFHVLVFNGIAANIVMSVYNALIWLSIVLTYTEGLPERSSTTMALTITFTLTIVWFLLESSLFLWYTRFTFSIYPTLMVTIISSLIQNWAPESRNFIILAVLLGVVCLFFGCHVILVISRLKKARRSFPTRQNSVDSFNIEFMTTRF